MHSSKDNNTDTSNLRQSQDQLVWALVVMAFMILVTFVSL